MTARLAPRETDPVRGLGAGPGGYAAQVTARRKLAVGKAILVEGPVSLARITVLCREAGVPIEGSTWPTTVRTFLVALGGNPRRWKLTETGRAWVDACVAGEAAPAQVAQ